MTALPNALPGAEMLSPRRRCTNATPTAVDEWRGLAGVGEALNNSGREGARPPGLLSFDVRTPGIEHESELRPNPIADGRSLAALCGVDWSSAVGAAEGGGVEPGRRCSL